MITCTQCGQANPEGARFCNACAMPLTAEPEAPREVRKVVTVLFCDVVGSTELGERFDPEVLRGVMSRFYSAIREPVERHGGTVEKVIGDALVAVFGIPVVHEDDALRAVRAALEMRDAVRAMPDIEARIGVNTGDVLARDATLGESLVVGDAVNVAARLEQATAAGEVLVGEATWSLVAHAARGERVAPVAAKGKREPLVAWRLDGVDPAAGGHRRRLDLPMIGREVEVDLLRWALERTVQSRRPHLVTVLGQPGIGKSRLVSEIPRLGDGFTILTGRCRAVTGSSSLEPLLEVARGAVGDGRSVAEGVAALMPGDSEAEAVASCLDPAASAGAADVGWAASRLLGAMTAGSTVVMVLEDVHWADDVLLDVVEQLVGRARRRPLLAVCTARPEFVERRTEWGIGANATSVSLERLNDVETRRLLARAGPALPPDQTERIIAAAEGNPLFAEHLVALVGDQNATGGLPRSIQVLLTARLEALPEPEREVVGVAAVAGREFPVAAVEALVARPLAADLEHLAQRELIEPTGAGRWQFGHALLQEAAYLLIPKQRRSELHERLAQWAAESGASDAVVGDHLERAAVLRAELGRVDEGTVKLREDAAARLVAAGRRADAMGDPARARRLLERALNLLSDDSPGRAGAMVELAAAGWNLLPDGEVPRLLEVAAALAAGNGLRALELRARVLRLGGGWEDPSHSVILAETAAALLELEALDDRRALATALTTAADAEFSLGKAADGVASARRAIDVLRSAEEDTVWAVSMLVLAVLESPMPVATAEALFGELLDELGVRPTVRSELIQGQAVLAQLRGEGEEAWRLLDVAREIEHDLGRRRSWRFARTGGRMLFRAGRFDEAQGALRLFAEEMERGAFGSEAAIARGLLAIAQVHLGRLDDARADCVAARDVTGNYEARTRALLALCEVHMAMGEVDDAVRCAREAVAVAGTGDWTLMNAEAVLTLARALKVAGQPQEAAAQAQTALTLYGAKGALAGATETEAFLESLALAQT